MTHILKTWPAYYHRIQEGQKNFEVRKNDRDFQVGDTCRLVFFDPAPDPKQETGPECFIEVTITYILHGGQFGIEPGYCVFGFEINEHGFE